MGAAGYIAIGAAAGFLVALRFVSPPSESACCKRVSAAVREQLGDACGPLGELCQGLGDKLDIWGATPSLLDLFGVK
jgi:hypothetical protein